MGFSNVLSLLGGVAMFLFGMTLMGDGLKKIAGSKLEIVLFKLSGTPLKGVLLGTGVTSVIQSSCATSVMTVGFVNSAMMTLKQAVSIILGSILGTSITGWIISLSYIGRSDVGAVFSTATLTAVVAVVGIILRMFTKKQSNRHLGDILLGFSVLMFGMQTMSSAVSPLKESESFIGMLTRFSDPVLGILVGTLFTALLQSASAAIGILQALTVTGAVTFSAAFPIILGIAIGASVPVIMSAIGAKVDGKRAAFSYLFIEVISVLIIAPVYYILNSAFSFGFAGMEMNPFNTAAVNTVFRLLSAIAFFPLINWLCNLLTRIFKPSESEMRMTAEFDKLEERFLLHPAVAVEQAKLTSVSMIEHTRANLEDAISLFENYSDPGFAAVEENEGMIDSFEDKIGNYLIRVNSGELNPELSNTVTGILHIIGDLERISDHAMNLAECAREIHEKSIKFSDEGKKEIHTMISAVNEIMDLAFTSYSTSNFDTALKVEPLEEWIDVMCDAMKLHHVERIKTNKCTLENGFVFNDMLTNFERIADHCSNIAIATIETFKNVGAHEYIGELKARHENGFDEYVEEYSKKYVIE